jgi:hypothetical protein
MSASGSLIKQTPCTCRFSHCQNCVWGGYNYSLVQELLQILFSELIAEIFRHPHQRVLQLPTPKMQAMSGELLC